jgi:RNAse (barnase) inhibitor barstar
MFQIFKRFISRDYDNAYEAAGRGDLAATKYLLENDYELDINLRNNMYSAALYGGNIKVFEYVNYLFNCEDNPSFPLKYNLDDEIMNNAILQLVRTENTKMIEYLYHHDYLMFSTETVDLFFKKVAEVAICECKPKVLTYWWMNIVVVDVTNFTEDKTLFHAIKNDSIDMIDYWMNNNPALWMKMSDSEYEKLLENSLIYAKQYHKKRATNAIKYYINLYKNDMGCRSFARNMQQHLGR